MSDAWNIDPLSHMNHNTTCIIFLTGGRNIMQKAFVKHTEVENMLR